MRALSDPLTHDLLVGIGILTIILLLLFLIGQFLVKLHRIYRTREPYLHRYPSYQQLIKSNDHLCQCLPNLPCVKINCQISHRCVNYEQINERCKSNSIAHVCRPCSSPCVHNLSKK